MRPFVLHLRTILCILVSIAPLTIAIGQNTALRIGTTNNERGYALTNDPEGNVYVTGHFYGTVDFDPGLGVYNLSSPNAGGLFVLKLDRFGTFGWAVGIPASNVGSSNIGYGITVDGNRNVCVVGLISYTGDVDPGPGTTIMTSSGVTDIFVWKLDSLGNFKWAKQMGGINPDQGNDIAVDSAGNVYTTGYFNLTADFDPGPGVYNLVASPGIGDDAFISKLDSSGNFIWAKRIGAAGGDEGHSIALDSKANVYVTGGFELTVDLDPGPAVSNHFSAGSWDSFVIKLNTNGDLIWAKSFGGTGNDFGEGICVDAFGKVYSNGHFNQNGDFDPGSGTFNLASAGDFDVYLQKLDSLGNLIWVKDIATGLRRATPDDLAIDEFGGVYSIGSFAGTTDFNPGAGTFSLTTSSQFDYDCYIQKVDSMGNFVWVKRFGGTPNQDQGFGIALEDSNHINSTGVFYGTVDFDPGPGIYNLTSAGMEDIFISKLNFCPPAARTTTITACDSYTIYGQAYTNSGTYTIMVSNGQGCDSIITLNLTIKQATFSSITQIACSGFTLNNQTYNATGTYTQALVNANGCDSTLTLNLTINGNNTTGSLTQSACDSLTINNQTFTSSGTYSQTLTNIAGCDSTLTLHLTILQSTSSFINQTACDSFSLNNVTYSTSGIYTQVRPNSVGCDSTITLNLVVGNNTFSTITQAVCGSFTLNNQTYNATGTYTQALVNANGCDSTLTLNLTINGINTTGSVTQSACDSLTINNQTFTSSGTFSQTLTNLNGCDSILTLQLTILQPTNSYITQGACDSFSLNNITYPTTGVYTQVRQNSAGCDSTITLDLTLVHGTSAAMSMIACDSLTINNQTFTTGGVYSQSLTNVAGCDSTLGLTLTINHSTSGSINPIACNGYWLNNVYYANSGNYIQVLQNASGCDSVLSLMLTMNSVDTTLTQNGITLLSNSAGSSYQWLDCDNGFAIINGANAQSFTPNVSGTYAVALNGNGCIDTSNCVQVVVVGIAAGFFGEQVRVFPNPSNGKFSLVMDRESTNATIKITDLLGQPIFELQGLKTGELAFDLSIFANGFYIIEVLEDGLTNRAIIIKDR
jgi:hypothetical protein